LIWEKKKKIYHSLICHTFAISYHSFDFRKFCVNTGNTDFSYHYS